MSDLSKNSIREKRFDLDSSQGFDFVHGSNEYFNSINNPFKSAGKSFSISHLGFLSLEIVVIVTLILTAKLIDINTNSTEFTFAAKNPKQTSRSEIVVEEKFIIDEPIVNETTNLNKIKRQNQILPSTFSNAIHYDSSSTLLALNSNGLIEKVDSVSEVEPICIHRYNDVKSKYELRYINDLLVIDYSDTIFTGQKLNPLLTGVPAVYENKDKIITNQVNQNPANTFVKRDDYLDQLAKPLKLLSTKKYEKSLKLFNELAQKNPTDQNVLFYAGLAYYNLANYSGALILLEKLNQINDALFEEDADWLLVKVYAGLGLTEKSSKLLNTIAHSNSFYRTQAIGELKK